MISLDGYTEGSDKELDWHFVDEEYESYSNELLRSIDAILLGRKTYELFSAYWPGAESHPDTTANPVRLESAQLLNRLPKHVITTTLKQVDWQNSHIIHEDVINAIARLKAQPGRNIALFGSSQLAAFLSEHQLIDEYRVIINPIILGEGVSLFNTQRIRMYLHLVGMKKFRSGVIALTYTAKERAEILKNI